MAITTVTFPAIQARHIKTAIVTSIPTCSGVLPRGSLTLKLLFRLESGSKFDSILNDRKEKKRDVKMVKIIQMKFI